MAQISEAKKISRSLSSFLLISKRIGVIVPRVPLDDEGCTRLRTVNITEWLEQIIRKLLRFTEIKTYPSIKPESVGHGMSDLKTRAAILRRSRSTSPSVGQDEKFGFRRFGRLCYRCSRGPSTGNATGVLFAHKGLEERNTECCGK